MEHDDSRTGAGSQMCRLLHSNVRVTGAKRAQRGTQFSIEVPCHAFPVRSCTTERNKDDENDDSSMYVALHTEAPMFLLFLFFPLVHTRRVEDEKHLLARRVHQSLSAGDDSVPAAVVRRAGERESEAPLGESESGMVGVTASAPIDARRCRPSGQTTLPLCCHFLFSLASRLARTRLTALHTRARVLLFEAGYATRHCE